MTFQPLPPDLLSRFAAGPMLPDPLPQDPMPLFHSWFKEAAADKRTPNTNAMTLATVGPDGAPSARIVLCRGIAEREGYVVFYTNYDGRKGRELEANPRAALVFHWDHEERQVRIEGPVIKSPHEESDAYFAGRPWESRLSAWASRQSEPIEGRGQLMARVGEVMDRLGLTAEDLLQRGAEVEIPRPANWGGFRVWAERIELWQGGPGRFHDRARWERSLTPKGVGYVGGPWKATRLSP